MDFPCTKCGVCCKNISNIPVLADFDNGNGVCKHLDLATNECKIYKTRPEVCQVDVMFEKYFSKYYSKDFFYKLNIDMCNILQEYHNIDKSYRVKFKN